MKFTQSAEPLVFNLVVEISGQTEISVARKLGCPVFLTWEDIINVNKNMLMTFVANLMVMDMTNNDDGNSKGTLLAKLTKEMMGVKAKKPQK